MYKNGDPKKKVAKTDATSVSIVRHDIPLPSSDNLFDFKDRMGMKKTKTPLPKSYYTMNKTKTTKSN